MTAAVVIGIILIFVAHLAFLASAAPEDWFKEDEE